MEECVGLVDVYGVDVNPFELRHLGDLQPGSHRHEGYHNPTIAPLVGNVNSGVPLGVMMNIRVNLLFDSRGNLESALK